MTSHCTVAWNRHRLIVCPWSQHTFCCTYPAVAFSSGGVDSRSRRFKWGASALGRITHLQSLQCRECTESVLFRDSFWGTRQVSIGPSGVQTDMLVLIPETCMCAARVCLGRPVARYLHGNKCVRRKDVGGARDGSRSSTNQRSVGSPIPPRVYLMETNQPPGVGMPRVCLPGG